MGNMLTDSVGGAVRYHGKCYRTVCSFDTVLEVQRMYHDTRLSDYDKVRLALNMLSRERFKVWLLKPWQKAELLDCIVREQIELPKRPQVGKVKTKTFDFKEDSDYIYASFMQAYGIDLVECQGRLHWKKFIALFQGLPENTKIREVMRIRGMEQPKPTKHNQKEIQELMELKAYYALGYREENGKEGLDRLFVALEGMAR